MMDWLWKRWNRQQKRYRLSAAGRCDIGKVRSNNEDNLYFGGQILPQEHQRTGQSLMETVWTVPQAVYGVFDGMGGEENGEVASFLAAQALKQAYIKQKLSGTALLEHAVQEMNAQVAAEADKVHGRVGTTSVMLAFQEDQLICCNVGDSRAYRLRNGVLSQLSTDHNDAEFLRRQGVTHRRPRLTQYIGLNPQELRICPSWFRDNVAAGDKYLLCSDGLTDMLSDDEIGALLQESGTPEESVELLVHEALKQGGCDNTTVIVVTVQEE